MLPASQNSVVHGVSAEGETKKEKGYNPYKGSCLLSMVQLHH
jgi:hypothetical protein